MIRVPPDFFGTHTRGLDHGDKGVKHLVDAGDRSLRNLGDVVQFLVVDCD